VVTRTRSSDTSLTLALRSPRPRPP
jgi:hypothetical protein